MKLHSNVKTKLVIFMIVESGLKMKTVRVKKVIVPDLDEQALLVSPPVFLS